MIENKSKPAALLILASSHFQIVRAATIRGLYCGALLASCAWIVGILVIGGCSDMSKAKKKKPEPAASIAVGDWRALAIAGAKALSPLLAEVAIGRHLPAGATAALRIRNAIEVDAKFELPALTWLNHAIDAANALRVLLLAPPDTWPDPEKPTKAAQCLEWITEQMTAAAPESIRGREYKIERETIDPRSHWIICPTDAPRVVLNHARQWSAAMPVNRFDSYLEALAFVLKGAI